MHPEFSQTLFHPEVDAFKDIPRLPGESFANEEEEEDPTALQPPGVEQCSEAWSSVTTYDHMTYTPDHMTYTPSPSGQAMIDDLRMTDQELDGILELKGEI